MELVSTGKDNGLGWLLTLVDTLLAEYGGYTLKTVRHIHLGQAFALYAAIGARYDHEPTGPTYDEAEMIRELEERKKAADPAWQA